MSAGGRAISLEHALRAARAFRGASPAVIQELTNRASARTLKEGELLWRTGDDAQVFTVIQRGLVQIERRTGNREPAILGIFGPRESVGAAAVLGGRPYPADAVVLSELVTIVKVPRELVLAVMERNPTVARSIQEVLLEHMSALTAKIDVVSAGSVPARLATLLLQLAERFGDEDEDEVCTVPVLLSRSALARMVSARVETVIRTLSGWNKVNLVRTTALGFEIADCAALRALADQE